MSPQCTFCLLTGVDLPHLEKTSHLFSDCKTVKKFWIEVADCLDSLGVTIPLDRKVLLFGIHDQSVSSVSNVVILNAKQYIWGSKHARVPLHLTAFKKHLYTKLTDLRNAYLHINEMGIANEIKNAKSLDVLVLKTFTILVIVNGKIGCCFLAGVLFKAEKKEN